MKKVKGYDVYFTLESPASILVAASNAKEAKELAYDVLSNMSKSELIDRILSAYDFCGAKVLYAELADELTNF